MDIVTDIKQKNKEVFTSRTNTFCTGQSIVVDGGESIKHNFIWKS